MTSMIYFRRAGVGAAPWLLAALTVLSAAFPRRAIGEGAPVVAWDPSGSGLALPANVWVAGDLSLEGGIPRDQPASFALDEFSLLARWDATARLALFGELRLGDQIIFTEGEGWDTSSLTVALERLYAEAILTPRLTLRVGKVFTPFGLWNVTNRGPFTWTVDGPAVVEGLFPIHATGLSLHHQTNWNGWSIDGVAYGPAQDEPPLRPTNERGWLVGGRVAAGRNLGSAFASIGLNLASFRPRDRVPRRPVWSTATGVDLDLSVGGHSVTGELAFRTPAGGGRTAHGMYFQDAIPLDPWLPVLGNLHAVGRFEYFQAPRGATALGAVFGLFWRPWPHVVLRGDYTVVHHPNKELPAGFHATISLLF